MWQGLKTRWKRLVVRSFAVLGILVLMFSSAFGTPPGMVISTAHAASVAASRGIVHRAKRPPIPTHPLEAAAWHNLIHYANRRPAKGARLNAIQQAGTLPYTGNVWTPLGPQPENSSPCQCGDYGLVSGRVTAIAVNPSVSSGTDVWVGAADGGVWHTTNGGTTWVPVLDSTATGTESPAEAIGAIAINPTNTQEIFVGTGEANQSYDAVLGAGIYHSTDGGDTFSLVGANVFTNAAIARIAVSSSTTSWNVLAAASGGLFLSLDQAHQTWQQVVGTDATDVVFDPADPNIVYAGFHAQVTINGSGQVTSSPVMRSVNGGVNWTPVDLGLPNNTQVNRTTLGISADGTHIYAVLTDTNGNLLFNHVYQSADSGASWQPLPVPSYMAVDSNEHQWAYNSTVVVDPNDPTVAYVGGVDLWYWEPTTSTWLDVTNTYGGSPSGNSYHVHPDHHALVTIPGTETFYDGNDGGVYKFSKSGGWTFTNLNGGGLDITQFYGGSIGVQGGYPELYGGAQDNGESYDPVTAFATTQEWTETFGGDGGDTAVDYTNNAIVYEEYANGDMYKSTNGGGSWTEASYDGSPSTSIDVCWNFGKSCPATPYDPVNFVMPFILSPGNHNELFAGTDKVYQTTNAAGTWAAISPQLDPYPCTGGCNISVCNGTVNSATCYWPLTALAVAPSNDTFLYAGDTQGHIYTTSGTGINGWTGPGTGTPSGIPVTGLAVDPTNPSTVYATFAGYGTGDEIFQSSDGGANWTNMSGTYGSGGLPEVPFESVVVNPIHPQQVIAASDAGVYIGYQPVSNGAWTWSHLGYDLPDVEVSQVFFNPGGTILFLATHGRGMWVLPLVTGSVYLGAYFGAQKLNVDDGSLVWQYQPQSTFGDGVNRGAGATLGNNALYFVEVPPDPTNTNQTAVLHALDPGTGTELWHYTFNYLPSGAAHTTPATSNGIVYVGVAAPTGTSGGYIYAFNASSGALIWSYQTSKPPTATPTIANGVLYVQAADNYLYALNASSGAFIWKYSLAPDTSASPVSPSAAAVANNMVYVGSSNGVIYALNASNGSKVWSYTTAGGSPVTSTPVVVQSVGCGICGSNAVVYVGGGEDDHEYALNASTGAVKWQISVTSIASSPSTAAVANGVVYFGDDKTNALYAVSAGTGAPIWTYIYIGFQAGRFFTPTVVNGIVFVTETTNGYVWALRANNGVLVWNVQPNTWAEDPVIGA